MKRVLVTGSNGQLGKALQDVCPKDGGITFFFTDIDTLDITQATAVEQFIANQEIDLIINCAAYTAVDKAETDVETCEKINAYAPGLLAKTIHKYQGNMIHISTDYVFDGLKQTPYLETDTTNPQTIYGKTKLRGEALVQAGCPESVIIRTAWLCSPYGKNFVKTILQLGKDGKNLKVVYDQVGTPTFAHDLASAICQIITQGLVGGIYHFSNEGAISWYDFAQAIYEEAGFNHQAIEAVLTKEFPTPAHRPAYSVLNKQKIKTTYHLSIPYWKESLKRCMKSLL